MGTTWPCDLVEGVEEKSHRARSDGKRGMQDLFVPIA
jgi:hypothetical protein